MLDKRPRASNMRPDRGVQTVQLNPLLYLKLPPLIFRIEPMVSPPPPYTADPSNPSPADTTSPATDFSHGTTPSSASTVFSPYITIPSNNTWSANHAHTQSGSPAVAQATFPPPPPSDNARARSSSRNHTERLLAAMNLRSRNSPAATANAIETLQQNTMQILDYSGGQRAEPPSPPAARRAVSTGALGASYSTRITLEDLPHTERGFALPPPPPGPPPANVRSQSMSRASESLLNPGVTSSARSRLPLGRGTELGPIPPTPANWVDDDSRDWRLRNEAAEEAWEHSTSRLHEDQHVNGEGASQSHETAARDNDSGPSHSKRDSIGLVRTPAVRNRSKGIRERRSESIQGRHHSSVEPSAPPAVANALARPLQEIVISRKGDSLAGRRLSTRLTPKSAQFRGLEETFRSSDSEPWSGKLISPKSTPVSATFQQGAHTDGPNSASSLSRDPRVVNERSVASSFSSKLTSKPLPTPSLGVPSPLSPLAEDVRPVSHILHIPNEDNVNIPILSPESTQSLMDLEGPDEKVLFAQRAVERHRVFLEKEMEASSDSERLHLFIDHMVAESRIRRERYAWVFEDKGLEQADLVEGMFEEPEDQAVHMHLAELSKQASISDSRPSSATSFATSRRASTTTSGEPPVSLTIDTSVSDTRRKDYVPVLSPIASMSAVTGRDETESRGRAPSRWWESQSNPSNNGEGFNVLQRSKRESKYMSAVLEDEVSPYARSTGSTSVLQNELSPPYTKPTGSALVPWEVLRSAESALQQYNPDGHQSEKVALGGKDATNMSALPSLPTAIPAPFTPDPRKLDISRLITLPPPYPRRHPAVNNSHPDLADVRGILRTLQDNAEPNQAKELHAASLREKKQRADSLTKHQKSLHDQDMQFRMEHGEISQEQFDEAEVALENRLAQSASDLAQQDFDLYQSLVVAPLHNLYTDRIARATSAFTALSSRLHEDSRTHSPNLPQEAGDEQPELLERLTILKWLFEARESLHRDLFDLLSMRNDRYKAVVLTPFAQPPTRSADKYAEATAFFAADALSRRGAADKASLARWQTFEDIVEQHATRGVEVQLSAFWDIAPPLQALLQQVPATPSRLRSFEILIPRAEMDEDPRYWEHPLRYLYSTLLHAEASSRQFIDAQISLWCLVQEVREGCAGARWRADESRWEEQASKRFGEGDGSDDTMERRWQQGQMEKRKDDEVKMGVEDLKEKVAAVEEQWVEGLGGEIGRVKTGIHDWLEETGGWDEELEEGEG